MNDMLERAHQARRDTAQLKASGQIRRAAGTECKMVLHRENLDDPSTVCRQCGRSRSIMHVAEDGRIFCGDCCPGPECWPLGLERRQALRVRCGPKKQMPVAA